jgi:hypothetical protein
MNSANGIITFVIAAAGSSTDFCLSFLVYDT